MVTAVANSDSPVIVRDTSRPYNTTYYTAWSSECQNVNGATGSCSATGSPSSTTRDMLFSWGLNGAAVNSQLRLVYTGATSQVLKSITLKSMSVGAGGVMLGPAGGWEGLAPGAVNMQGFGAMVVYEQIAGSPQPGSIISAKPHAADEQRVGLRVLRSGAEVGRLDDQGVLTGLTSAYTNPEGFIAQEVDRTFVFTTPITVQPGDAVALSFFESLWQNANYGFPPELSFPDAYYGPMTASLDTIAPQLTSTSPFGNQRAGTTVSGNVQVTNTGDTGTLLRGAFLAPGSDASGQITPQSAGVQDFAPDEEGLPAGVSTSRTFTYVADDLGWDHTGEGPGAALTQSLTSNIGGQSVQVAGQTAGPVLALTTDATIPNDVARRLPYGNSIDLGEVEVNQAVVQDLLLANVFGTALGNVTTLTVFNVAITGANAAYFCIISGPDCLSSIGTTASPFTTLTAQQSRSLQVRFQPGAVGIDFTATLSFLTDMNRSFNLAAGDSGNTIIFNLLGDGTGTPTPVPATALLLLAGLASLRLWRPGGGIRR